MPSEFASHWTLEPGLTFLNHGSFGATPRSVLGAQQAWRDELEAQPVRFMVERHEAELDAARAALAAFIGADADDLAFIPNATSGVNTVLRSLRFAPDDELLTIDHAYNAVRNAMDYVAARDGAHVTVVAVPFPLAHASDIINRVMAGVTPRTRLAVLDHVTSATALVLPIRDLVAELSARGVETLVDGAHAPGMLDLDLGDLGAGYYTGNLHKWVSAPKGAAFVWVRRDLQSAIRPLVISHGANSPRTDRSRFRLEFDWLGTSDPSAILSVPAALEFGAGLLRGGWPALRERNHRLALEARDLLCAATEQPAPAPDGMIGSMASVPLAWQEQPMGVQGVDLYADPVHEALLRAGFEVMVTPWPQRPTRRWRRLIRVSCAAYNDRADMERLAEQLPAALAVDA
jgi:isopenicillin-N epimerase